MNTRLHPITVAGSRWCVQSSNSSSLLTWLSDMNLAPTWRWLWTNSLAQRSPNKTFMRNTSCISKWQYKQPCCCCQSLAQQMTLIHAPRLIKISMEKRHKPQVIHLYRAQVQQLLLYSTIGGGFNFKKYQHWKIKYEKFRKNELKWQYNKTKNSH